MFRTMLACAVLAAGLGAAWGQTTGAAETVGLETLSLAKMEQEWGSPGKNKSVDGHPLKIGGKEFATGVGTHASSLLVVDLKQAAVKFMASVGVDDEKNKAGSVVFVVTVDGKEAFNSGVMRGGEAAKRVDVDLAGAKTMTLAVTDGGDGIDSDHADWAAAEIVLAAGATGRPVSVEAPVDASAKAVPEIAAGDGEEPAIHGAKVVGTTPGRPFLFLIPATGKGKLSFAAENLPEGLVLDGVTGIITGSVKSAGEYVATLQARGEAGSVKRKLKIVAGEHKLALTPPMGWNSWNVWAGAVSQEKVKAAADAMVSSGLAAKGFTYINIDDCWEGKARDEKTGEITTNERFPDMKGLADYVHGKGLKLGIYSSPGPKTCGGYLGSYEHEESDAQVWARWGVDYVKYDWCSYGSIAKGKDLPALEKPYAVMRKALDKADRDIVFSLCQYGMGNVSAWGGSAEVGGNLWRTTGDITDSWASMSGIGFKQDALAKYAKPGQWNDPDMLVVGKVGWGPKLHATKLTPNEQVTHITLWSMLAAPLLIGCDMTEMDGFTKSLLLNPEVMEVDQDALGSAAVKVGKEGEVSARKLEDGTVAVALFNRGNAEAKVKVTWAEIDQQLPSDARRTDRYAVRDLWKRKDLGVMVDGYEATVGVHGAVLVRVGKGAE